MKLSLLIVSTCAAAALLAAQTPAPSSSPIPAPGAQTPKPPVGAGGGIGSPDKGGVGNHPTPAPAAPITPETVVVTVDGKNYTAKQMDDLLKELPPQATTMIKQNPDQGLTRLFLVNALSEDGKKRKLDEMSPYKETIESQQRQYLANTVVQDENTRIQATEVEQQTYYDHHKEQFQSVKVSAIYVHFTPNAKPGPDGKTPRTEIEARAKAEDLAKQLRAGADFAKVAQENSDDKTSAAKGGEYATIKRSDKHPPAIMDAVFKLKENEISDPVRQPAGFYIFKVTEKHQEAFAEVQRNLFEGVKKEKFDAWLKGMQDTLAPKIDTPEYFKDTPPAPGTSTTIATLQMPIAPDVVVATVGGKPYTKKQMDEFLKVLPPQGRVAIRQNPTAGLTNLFLIIQLSDEARKRKLDQESPHKESLEQMARFGMAQAVATEEQNKLTPTPADQEAYYKSHQADYESAKVSAILVSFATNPKPAPDGKTPRTEAEAKAKAEDLVKQLRAGGDFAKLALDNSDDKASAAKGGEYATIRRSSPSPDTVKQVVLGLKAGDVSDPVLQPAGFYIFKATSKDVQPFAEAAPTIAAKLKQEKFSEWLTAVQKQYRPKIERPDYFKK